MCRARWLVIFGSGVIVRTTRSVLFCREWWRRVEFVFCCFLLWTGGWVGGWVGGWAVCAQTLSFVPWCPVPYPYISTTGVVCVCVGPLNSLCSAWLTHFSAGWMRSNSFRCLCTGVCVRVVVPVSLAATYSGIANLVFKESKACVVPPKGLMSS